MPLTLALNEGRTKPIFVCDFCDKEIEDAFDGNYEWNDPAGNSPITDIKYLHKQCSRPYEGKFGRLEYNMGLHNLMVYLLNNLNLREDRLKQAYQNTADLDLAH